MTRGPLSTLYLTLFGDEIGSRPTLVSREEATILIKSALHFRMAKVKRSGRPGARRYELIPRNRAEWTKRPGVLR